MTVLHENTEYVVTHLELISSTKCVIPKKPERLARGMSMAEHPLRAHTIIDMVMLKAERSGIFLDVRVWKQQSDLVLQP